MDDGAAIVGELDAKIRPITRANYTCARIMAEHKGGKRDRTGKGLKRARWNIDNEPPNLPQPNELQMPDKRLNMPVSLKRRSGVGYGSGG